MRISVLILGIVWLASSAGIAQQPPPAAAPAPILNPAGNRLDALLIKWEESMKKIQALDADCRRTTIEKAFMSKTVYEGKAKYMRPNFAKLDMARKDRPDIRELYVCTGTFLYEWVPQIKQIRIHTLPQAPAGQITDDNFMSFLFGMKAEEAKRKYDLKLVKEDQWWVYIEIVPRFPADQADFQRARMVLAQNSFMPAQLWFEQPNGNEVMWEVLKLDNNGQLNRAEFAQPALPDNTWSFVRVPPQPRVVRPQQDGPAPGGARVPSP